MSSQEFPELAEADTETAVGFPSRDTLIGTVIDGRYRVDEKVGEGGMGAVYVATHLTLKKEVALKIIHEQFVGDGDIAERFAREAMVSAKLDHPNVASALDYGKLKSGGAYLVMQLVRGPSLQQTLEEQGSLGWPRACAIGSQIADALAAAYAEGIVHRDLKPDNILLEPRNDGSELVKVLDFGIARLGTAQQRGARNITRRGTVMGTPGYMAPEQALGEEVDHRADLYSLGVLVWEMVAGRPLFPSESLSEIVSEQLSGNLVPDLRQEHDDPTLPPELPQIVARCLARNASDRPHSPDEVRDVLRQLTLQASIDGHSGRITPPLGTAAIRRNTPPTIAFPSNPAPPPIPSPAERRKVSLLWIVAGVLLAVAASVTAVIALRPEQDPEEREELMEELRRQAREETAAEDLARQSEQLLEGETRSLREAAAAYIMAYEPAEEVPEYVRAVADLELASGCGQYADALERIRTLNDVRARASVDRLSRYARSSRRRRRRYRCVLDELRGTLSALPEPPEGTESEGEGAEPEDVDD